MKKANRTTVLIPNYNGMGYIESCLRSLRADVSKDRCPSPVLIIDNGSTDGSAELVEELAQEWEKDSSLVVRQIRLQENTGFCHAVNLGLDAIKNGSVDGIPATEFVFLLNNDTLVRTGAVAALERRMDSDKSIFAAQSQICSMYDSALIDDAGDLYCALGWAFARGQGKVSSAYGRARKVFACCGAAVMYRMSCFDELGMFDENHFAYLEDIDLGYRARIYGFKNVFEPKSVIFHAGSATSGSKHNDFKVNLSSQNSIYLIYKNMPTAQILINLPLLVAGFVTKLAFFGAKGMGMTYIKGLAKGFAKSFADARDGHRHKVMFRQENLNTYLMIQWELWANTVKRLCGLH